MLDGNESSKKEASAEAKSTAEGKQVGEAEKLEEVPMAEPVTDAKPEGEGEKADAKTEVVTGEEKKEGVKEAVAGDSEKKEKQEQPEQEPGDSGKAGGSKPGPVEPPTGEGDLEKGNVATGEEKKQENSATNVSTDPTFAELGESLIALMHKNGGWALFVSFASFILLIQSSVVLSQVRFVLVSESKFAVAYSVITMCAAFTFAMVMKFKGVPEKPRQLFIVLLFIWVIIGTGIVTFSGPFLVLSNGYFAAWAIVMGCYWMFRREATNASQYVENFRANAGYLTMLFVFSMIEFFSAVAICTGNVCGDLTIYAVVVGVVSALACIVLGVVTSPGSLERKITYSFLLLWWFIAMCALTFSLQAPFTVAGNGFFSLWASLAIAAILTFLEFRENPGLTA